MVQNGLTQSAFLLSAAHKSSGKTLVSVGLAAAWQRQGRHIQTFKKGPDYIDPLWLTRASGRPCRNLDLYLMSRVEVAALYQCHAQSAELCLVEGNKGLYDGLALDGSNSNAELAKMLGLPVVLVLDARGMTRGIAPLILGYQAFDRDIRIAGVILNQLGGRRHEAKLRAVIEHYTDIPVIGAIQHEPDLFVEESHLGLIPSNESLCLDVTLQRLAQALSDQVNLSCLEQLTQTSRPPRPQESVPIVQPLRAVINRNPVLRLGIIQDHAFGFYYPDDLEGLQAAGANLVKLSALEDDELPELDGLYIGGGFPERYARALAANERFRHSLLQAIMAGLPVYAECGGLMYLSRSLTTLEGETYPMVGAIPGRVVMESRPVGRGYVHLAENDGHPWPRREPPHGLIPAHEFHYSRLLDLPEGLNYAFEVKRGFGIDGQRDGLCLYNMLASYTHLRALGQCYWTARFMAFMRAKIDSIPSGEE
ncbi:MAG: cobyrinate a,c-diamide synthase [Ferrovum sp.]|nr:cobyrinate a,c-diamide synthase [Ferrovum sp.]NDU88150.1 cobyrinate a,c-diamide synthase [Ferrovum sp.]